MRNNGNKISMGEARPSVKSGSKKLKVAKPKTAKSHQVNKTKKSTARAANVKKTKTTSKVKRPGAKVIKNSTTQRVSVNDPQSRVAQRIKKTKIQRETKKKEAAKKEHKGNILSPSIKKKKEATWSRKGFGFAGLSSKTKKWILIALIAIVALAIGITVGIFAFIAATNSKLSVGSDCEAALVKPQENQPYYMLFSADIDPSQDGVTDMLLLARVDAQNKKVIIVSIPVQTFVASNNGGGTTLANICKSGNDAQLITAVSTFCEAGINHYSKMTANGLSSLVDSLGGIDVNLKEHVDDPKAGSGYISSGKSTINGQQTLTLLRATNFVGAEETIALNQQAVGAGLAKKVCNPDVTNMPMLIDKLAGEIKTDLSTVECIDFCNSLSGLSDENIKTTAVPGYNTLRNNNMVFVIDASAWKQIRNQISYGEVPQDDKGKTINDINPGSVKIYVRNGAGIDGAAAMVTEKLKSMGYNVVKSDNAEMNTYQETLIVYNGDKQKDNAEAVKNSLNNGRLVNGTGLYQMTTDILVIIGGDYKI